MVKVPPSTIATPTTADMSRDEDVSPRPWPDGKQTPVRDGNRLIH